MLSDRHEASAWRPGRVLVTGAASGIGRACARALARAGGTLVLLDRDARGLASVASELGGAVAEALPFRVEDEEAWGLLGERLSSGPALEGAVLAAGIARHTPLLDMTTDEWREMLDVHLTGAFLGIRTLGRHWREAGRPGSVVYLSSTVTVAGGPPHQTHYRAAKSGALGLVRGAARELGPLGVRVNAVSPGFTRTDLNEGLFSEADIEARAAQAPLGRVARPEDITGSVLHLLSPASGFVTGQVLHVSGGSVMP